MIPYTKKSVLITGCSAGGIGAGLADVFRQNGYHVFATARNPAKIPDDLSHAANVTVLPLDVLSQSSIALAVENVVRHTGGRLDVLINNSGANHIVPALDISIENAKNVFDLNVWAPLTMLQHFSPLLIKAKGCVVNNTSACAYAPFPLTSVYNSSKAALLSASETWRHELQPLGVRVIALVTTGVKTQSFADYHPIQLPEASLYYGVREFIYGIGDGRLQKGAISPRQYAEHVYRKVDQGSVGQVWAGTDAFSARLAFGLLPARIFDMVVRSIIPLPKAMGTQLGQNTAGS